MVKPVVKKRKDPPFDDGPFYPDWIKFSVSISPEILKEAKRFSKKHTIRMSQLVNSAVKVFISEAEEYIADQEKAKSWLHSERQEVKSKKTDSFRISKAFSTKDAIDADKFHFRNTRNKNGS